MKEYPMPGGVPVSHGNLNGEDLDSIFGFIEAYVVCPKTIKKPFLPYRDQNDTLIFPTGEFIGVYYSEELKYARDLGYTVIPISGYLFEKMESPFRDFVSQLFQNRVEAKKKGNDALSYVYMLIMNTLYGRFGINPKSTITVICSKERYFDLIWHSDLIFGDRLSETYNIISYHINTEKSTDYWVPPKNVAVQLAAAITVSARIYMYPFISREDCYYTDTDSVVLGHQLPSDVISSSDLGKFKLEDEIKMGYFLAPKSYGYYNIEGQFIFKFKGPAKNQIQPSFFEQLYLDPNREILFQAEFPFRVNKHTLNIFKKDSFVKVGIKLGNKRFFSTVSNNTWVTNSLSDLPLKDEDKTKLIRFWEEFYQYYLSKKEPQRGTNYKASNSGLYKEEVFSLLESKKGKLTEDELCDLQITIEDKTMNFDEELIYSSTKNIIKLLIAKELECARDYLRKWGFEADDMELLSEFGQYTLEALIVHVLAIVFNPNDSQVMVRVATLVEHLEKIVHLQAKLFKCRRSKLDFSSLKAMEDGENQRKKKIS
ncbi:DNA polymerase-like [Dioscorea cayenensis subsp. rotundata]|uniref:DNA-directed DNA polymerase n=1 Tax=Dioscorea cayennensis subsp. rotundata TaxID=55577 RepID=A0AB40CQZ7_DIOCR|nr:DNA polymerase-like [Dioscorea cayenensis subsp. rotundata]